MTIFTPPAETPTPLPSIRNLLISLFIVTLIIRALTAWSITTPGYFDAYYYFHVADNMAQGKGIIENVIWNFLDNPTPGELPRPGNQYWMPMANFIAWAGIAVFGFLGAWRASQIPFIVLSSLLVPFAAWIAWQAWGKKSWAIAAGLLTLFSGFYFVYWVVPDNFTPFAVTAAVCFWGLWKAQTESKWQWWAVAGIGAGLSHLTRIDGVLLVLLIAGFWFFSKPRIFGPAVVSGVGYVAVVTPWLLRNWLVVGTAFPGGGLQTLWLQRYDEFFAYDPNLSFARYLEWGAGNILASKVDSILTCALVILGSALFFMAPLVLIAVRRAATMPLFRPVLWYSVLLLTAMPLIFTYPAARGSLFHSSTALIPWFMAMVPYGLERTIRFIAARRRAWNVEQATLVLGSGFLVIAALITLSIYLNSVWIAPAPDAVIARWNERTKPFAEVEAWMDANARPDDLLFVGEPAGYYVVTGRQTIITPSDGVEALTRAAQEWNVHYLLLDKDSRGGYLSMYDDQQAENGWVPVATFTDGLGLPQILFRYEP